MHNAEILPITRRDFLRRSGLIAVGGLASRIAGAAEAAPLRVAFVTDTHYMLGGALGSARGIVQCLKAIEALQPAPKFILCGGDLTQELPNISLNAGEKHLDDFLRLWKDSTGLPTRWTLGNHDLAGTLESTASRTDPRFGEGLYRQRLGWERSYYSFDAGAWHFVVLDDISFEPKSGAYVGDFSAEQLAFLRQDLTANAARPTAICCHIPAMSAIPAVAGLAKALGARPHPTASLVVKNTQALRDVIKETGAAVKLVLSGHLHYLERMDVQGIHFLTSGAVCGNWWKGPRAGCSEGFTVLDLQADGRFEANYQTYGWTAVTS